MSAFILWRKKRYFGPAESVDVQRIVNLRYSETTVPFAERDDTDGKDRGLDMHGTILNRIHRCLA